MGIGLGIAIASLGVAVIGLASSIPYQRRQRREQARQAQERERELAADQERQATQTLEEDALRNFKSARKALKHRRGALAARAIAGQGEYRWDGSIPLLTLPGWIPSHPLPLSEVSLRLNELTEAESEPLASARSELLSLGYWPLDRDGLPLPRYSSAILEYDATTQLSDRPSYRLIELTCEPGPAPRHELTFSPATYFDGIDTSEPIAHEVALREKLGSPGDGPYRTWLANPFRLGSRAAMPGINTLTVRRSERGPHFFMHQRGADAAVSMGVFHVAPAGDFQPQIDDPAIWAADLNILSNIIREYAEEFLGIKEADGTGGCRIDYEEEPPYSELSEAYRQGSMKVFYLGTGLDPLSWKPEILTACVFDEDSFDAIFMSMVPDKIDHGTGGYLLTGKARSSRPGLKYEGIPFKDEEISKYADPSRTLPAGVACLSLAKRWMNELLP